MKQHEIKGKQIWVTRDDAESNYWLHSKNPKWYRFRTLIGGYWESGAQLIYICPELFKRWLGAKPTAKLTKGGPKAIEKATLYVALDWAGLE